MGGHIKQLVRFNIFLRNSTVMFIKQKPSGNDMKHNTTVTIILLALFTITQLAGLGIIAHSMDVDVDEQGTVSISYPDTAIGERPDTQGASSFILLVVGVGVGTLVLLLLIKFKQVLIWKVWYFLAVTMTIAVALGAVITVWIAAILAILLASWKIFRPNMIVHNLTELFVYAGIALLISPLLNVLWASAVLIAFALYDMYAVWKSKHMIAMAQFQTDSKLFAGMIIPYDGKHVRTTIPKKAVAKKKSPAPAKGKSAILGGGDIALPLIFSGVVLHWLVEQGIAPMNAYALTLIISLMSAIALFGLFFLAKKDRFYPAMPPIAIGCFIGLGIIAILI